MILALSLRPDVTIVAVPVPREATKPTIKRFEGKRWHVNWLVNDDPNVLGGLCIFYNQFGGKKKYPNHLEPIGLLREIPEEQAAGLVAWEFDTCRDYTSPGEDGSYVLTNPTDALKSAIKANGGDPEQNWLLLKKIQ